MKLSQSWGVVYQHCCGKLSFKAVRQVPLARILHFNILNNRACNSNISYFTAKIIFLNSELFFLHPYFVSKSSNASLKLRRKPRESDFETIKLISNGAYGWVIQENSLLYFNTPEKYILHIDLMPNRCCWGLEFSDHCSFIDGYQVKPKSFFIGYPIRKHFKWPGGYFRAWERESKNF